MRFIQRTSFLALFALGAVSCASHSLPEPSEVPLITAIPIPSFIIAPVPPFVPTPGPSDPPFDTPAPSDLPIDTPTPSDNPIMPTPAPTDTPIMPTPAPTDTPVPSYPPIEPCINGPCITKGPTVSAIPPNPTNTVSPAPTHGKPGCDKGCVTQSPGPVPSPTVKDVCFDKKQTCCYKLSVCSTRTKEVKYCKAVKVIKCHKKCAKKCIKVPKTTMKKKCKKQTVYESRKGCIIKWFGMCKPVAVEKEVCCDHAVTTYEKVCKNICKPICKPVTVFQIIIKKFKYETFCAKLSCGNIKVVGKAVKPAPYTSKTLVHKTNGKVVDNKPAGVEQIH